MKSEAGGRRTRRGSARGHRVACRGVLTLFSDKSEEKTKGEIRRKPQNSPVNLDFRESVNQRICDRKSIKDTALQSIPTPRDSPTLILTPRDSPAVLRPPSQPKYSSLANESIPPTRSQLPSQHVSEYDREGRKSD